MTENDEQLCVLSVDVEPDWAGFSSKCSYEGVHNLSSLLRFSEENEIVGTLFVTGDAASSSMVWEAIDRGFEIACHGLVHERLDRLTAQEAQSKIRASKDILKRLTGEEAHGFRAPYASINTSVLEIISEEGFEYDSSLLMSPFHATNIRARHLRLAFWSPKPFRIEFHDRTLLEFPISISFFRIPLGSYYLQLLGYRLGSLLIRPRGTPAMLYTHSWTISDVPAPEGVNVLVRNFAYRGVGARESRILERMLVKWRKQGIRFVTSREAIRTLRGRLETIPSSKIRAVLG